MQLSRNESGHRQSGSPRLNSLTVMSRLLKQPLLWFVTIGGVLFLADALFSIDRTEITVSSAMRDRLGTLWQTQTGQAATAAELDSLVENWVREEVLYQEALRLGLDQEDSIIRRRLVQKLGFIAESDPTAAPEIADLQAYFQTNIEAYTLPLRYSFRQLYFQSPDDAKRALEQINQGADPSQLGETSMLSANYAYRSGLDLNANFGTGFADRLHELNVGEWLGPVASGFGYHLVLLTAVHETEVSPFARVQAQVAMDYQQYQQETAREQYIDRLLDQYTITVEAR